jgi:hypothetical protein
VISTTVSAQRTIVHTTTNAVPPAPAWPSIAEPMDAPNTISAAPLPPSTSVAIMSGIAYSRLAANLRSAGTS